MSSFVGGIAKHMSRWETVAYCFNQYRITGTGVCMAKDDDTNHNNVDDNDADDDDDDDHGQNFVF